MKVSHRRDVIGGALLIAVGLGFATGSLQYGLGTSVRPGPGYFPLGLGVLLSLVGAALCWQGIVSRTADGGTIGPIAWRPLGFVLGAALLFALLLPRAGLVVALPALVIVCSLAVPQPRWWAVLISAAVLTLGAWLVFNRALGLTLPILPPGLS